MKSVYCCDRCFSNEYLCEYIRAHYDQKGKCCYCNTNDSFLISTKNLGIYMRECINKAYENYDEGTGAYYDDEDKQYCGPDGNEADVYSIREILMDYEMILDDKVIATSLLEDLFENLYSYREIQKGAEDPYDDIDANIWVLQGDLYGSEQMRIYHAWEGFKFVIKHYNRFFDCEGYNPKEAYLEELVPYIYDFVVDIPVGTKLYRTRVIEDDSISELEKIDSYSHMGPPPAEFATTNRMNPAGIPYLYLATDIDTTLLECRVAENANAITAEFITKNVLQIVDLSDNRYYAPDSIFDPDYDHDNRWINGFWRSFVKEISMPVSDDKKDHSYEYTATQLVAEFFRKKGFDGVCFKSSVGSGKNYVFFFGPDPEYTSNAYPYPFNSPYFEMVPILEPYTEMFDITELQKVKKEKDSFRIIGKRII